MARVRRVVVDVLKPHDPPILEFTNQLSEVDCVEAVTSSLVELDNEVQNLKLTLEGEDIDLTRIEAEVTNLGGTVHSVDQVACGEYVVEDRRTPQD